MAEFIGAEGEPAPMHVTEHGAASSSHEALVIHLAIRLSDDLFQIGDVIQRHREVLAQHRAVWLGKFGAAPGRLTLARLLSQLERGVTTSVWLLASSGKERRVYRAALAGVSHTPPDDRNLVPTYYAERRLLPHVGFWLLFDTLDEADKAVMRELVVVSSGRSLQDAVRSSMSGFFVVSEGRT